MEYFVYSVWKFFENSPTTQLLAFLVIFPGQRYFNVEDAFDGMWKGPLLNQYVEINIHQEALVQQGGAWAPPHQADSRQGQPCQVLYGCRSCCELQWLGHAQKMASTALLHVLSFLSFFRPSLPLCSLNLGGAGDGRNALLRADCSGVTCSQCLEQFWANAFSCIKSGDGAGRSEERGMRGITIHYVRVWNCQWTNSQ